jgi:N-acetylmuramoyl-L-alanine amidase
MAKIIALDAGHGGTDPGAIGNGLQEKNVALDVTRRLQKALLTNWDVEVVLVRDADKLVDLSKRDDIAEQAGAMYFCSIHIDASTDPKAEGFSSFIHTKADAQDKQKQSIIHQEVMGYLKGSNVKDRGMKTADFAVLREFTGHDAILLENTFVTNPKDAANLKKPAFLDGLGLVIAKGLAKALELPTKPVELTVLEAVKILQAHEITNSPDYWITNARSLGKASGTFTGELIKKMARKLKGPAELTTLDAIKVLQGYLIINSPDYWVRNTRPGTTANGTYVGELIKKMAHVLKGGM